MKQEYSLENSSRLCSCFLLIEMKLEIQRIKAYDMFQPQKIAGSTPPHDAIVVASIIDSKILHNVQLRRVDVDFNGGICDGRTMVDCRVYPDNPPNIHIAFDCDRLRFVKLLKDTIQLSC